jgi:hypothetical protein
MRNFFKNLLLLKFSRFTIVNLNLIIGNLILFSVDEKGDSVLPVIISYSVVSVLILLVFLHLTVNSKLANSLIALIATLIIPLLGTIFLFHDIIAGLMAGFIGIIAYARYWVPMAVLNIFLFIRFDKTFQSKELKL